MTFSLATACLLFVAAPFVASLENSDSSARLVYKGKMEPAKAEKPGDGRKEFQIEILVGSSEQQTEVLWTLQEEGQGAWPALERFGVWSPFGIAGIGQPSLLYQREDGKSVVPLSSLVLKTETTLKKGAAWKSGKLQFEVVDSESKRGRKTWKVIARDAYGVKRTLWIDQQSKQVVSGVETVFIGRGERFSLTWELVKAEPLPAAEMKAMASSFQKFAQLRENLKLKRPAEEMDLKPQQLAMLRAELPALLKDVAEGPLRMLAKTVLEDAKDQKSRNNAVSALGKRILGNKSPRFELEGLRGAKFTSEQLAGRTTVLQFWTYRDTPLQEPYGQVGYLDFLARRFENKKGKPVQVFGVAVNRNLDDRRLRGKTVAGIKRFHSFMNLSFPVLLDNGETLKKFGDPRPAGAKLPLFVVISPKGQVVHYHVGFYEVSRDNGLEELDQVIQETAK